MKNIEKYKDIILDNTDVCSINRLLLKNNIKGFCSGFACVGCEARAIKWLLEEAKEPVLDEVERKYLYDVIKPFRNRVTAIAKYESTTWVTGKQFIRIQLLGEECSEFINLPWFKSNTMYKGMKLNKEYTLKELGL